MLPCQLPQDHTKLETLSSIGLWPGVHSTALALTMAEDPVDLAAAEVLHLDMVPANTVTAEGDHAAAIIQEEEADLHHTAMDTVVESTAGKKPRDGKGRASERWPEGETGTTVGPPSLGLVPSSLTDPPSTYRRRDP